MNLSPDTQTALVRLLGDVFLFVGAVLAARGRTNGPPR